MLRTMAIVGTVVLTGSLSAAQDVVHDEDSLIAVRIFEEAKRQRVNEQSMGEVVVWVGKQFSGAPYVPHTLEIPDGERLVVNLREFDCVTFVESVLALAQCITKEEWTYDDFKKSLRHIRYRDGVLDGYASRLHYFSEWIADNQKKGVVTNITPALGGELKSKPIDWMTRHRSAYRQLTDREQFERIAAVERKRSRIAIAQIPRASVGNISDELVDGDIVAFVSNRSGLDVGHVALAVLSRDGSPHLLHASDRSNAVVVTQETLDEYFQYLPNASGIMVARPIMKFTK